MARPVRIRTVDVQDGFVVRLGLTDDTTKTVDLQPYMRGPIFEPIRNDVAAFSQVRVDPRAGTIVWPNGADIDPDVLCLGLEPCWQQDEPAPASSSD